MARAGSAASVGTAEVDGPSVACIGAAAEANREPELTCSATHCCGSTSIQVAAEWPSPAMPR